ncbi:hypothetical protein [Deinococcus sonorensis]|uniref:Transposase n=2 Tax=Deinococcus sonorensis TaxID=309891 RepID=A0AAU7UFN1_9DEIO
MAFLNRLIDRLLAKPVAAHQPTTVPASPHTSSAVNFDDFLRALGADL